MKPHSGISGAGTALIGCNLHLVENGSFLFWESATWLPQGLQSMKRNHAGQHYHHRT